MYVWFRYANNGIDSAQEYTKIQPKTQAVEIKKEKPDSTQVNKTVIAMTTKHAYIAL